MTTTREVFYGVISQGVAPYFYAMEENNICSFFGLRKLTYMYDEFFTEVLLAVLKIFEEGCHTFYFSGKGEFNALCHKVVTFIKEEHENYVPVYRVLCLESEEDMQKLSFSREDYEEVLLLSTVQDDGGAEAHPHDIAMINAADHVIALVEEKGVNRLHKAYKYAKKKNKDPVNLWEKYEPVLVPRSQAKKLLRMQNSIVHVE